MRGGNVTHFPLSARTDGRFVPGAVRIVAFRPPLGIVTVRGTGEFKKTLQASMLVGIWNIQEVTMKLQFIEAGEIVTTHGVRGEMKVLPWVDSPEVLCEFERVRINGKE